MASSIKKTYSDSFKLLVVRHALDINNFSATARKYNLNNKTVGRWVKIYKPQIEDEMNTNTIRIFKKSELCSDPPQRGIELEILKFSIRFS